MSESKRESKPDLHGNSFAAYYSTHAVSCRRVPIFLVLTFPFDQIGGSECRGNEHDIYVLVFEGKW